MAEQLPAQDLAAIGAVTGIAGLEAIAAVERADIAAGTPVDVGGGHYAFQPNELKSVITGWEHVITTLTSGKTTTVNQTPHSPAVMTPGNEHASNVASDAAHATNQAYQAYLTNVLSYAQGVHQKLSTAYNNYLTTEQSGAGSFRGLEA
jgi:hypothetical protein